jgi:hypothetical protein
VADIYQYITYAQARQQLANRLYDPTKQFWSDTELKNLLLESLRTWNAITAFWRGDFTFQTSPGVIFYDLTDAVNLPNTLRPLTIGTNIYLDIQFALLEPAVGANPWTGVSSQFTANDLINAVQRRQDEILSVTGCTVTKRTVPAVAGRIALPDTVIDVLHMAYIPAVGAPSIMWPEDTWAEQSFQTSYLQNPAGTPFTYLLSTEPPISFDVDRAPGSGGSYELLTVEAGSNIGSGSNYGSGLYGAGTYGGFPLLSIPDDWMHLVKWGALADLLSRESNAKDMVRAQYCEQRYRMGLELLSRAPALLAIRLANINVPVQVDSIREANTYRAGWRGEAAGSPNAIFQAGLNMLAVAPPPDSGPYSITATVVENAPIPSGDSANLQVAREDLDAILDYAEHIAAFKMGGSNFTSTMPLLQRFIAQATIYNRKLKEMGEYQQILYGLSQQQESMAPRMAPAAEEAS